ncbi:MULTISPECIES: LysR family transcriptional regulator [unclassified Caulobacter]|uniref:LysR family transcriptional regulator n=1 Tax=unclassified Caulobacter TaxID=2648921 RepID=UPI0004A786ED|nr:LysR family transcriptional regulator [Caulobacter sp. UNC358MFTsu5.1]
MSERLSGIATFVEAVEAGGFAPAAPRLGLTRSAVGKTIARLEARLGVRLFHRTTRSQSLTEDGQMFYERCVRALAELEAAEAALESGRAEPAGRLRVTAPVIFGRHCVAPILLDLVRRHPALELDLSFSDRPADLIEDGFDLAVRNGGLPDRAGLVGRRVAGQRMTVCASPAYLDRHGRPQRLEDIAGHRAVLYGRGDRSRRWLFPTPGGPDREVTPVARIRFDDLEAIAEAAAAGLGLAWLPCWLVREPVASGRLERVLTDLPGLVFDTHLIWPQAPHLPLRVRAAIDALAAELPKMMLT